MDRKDELPSGCQSPLPTRNPSPPPELQDNEKAMADIIKGTLISKKWIFSILLKLLQEVQKANVREEQLEENEFGVDVDEALQDELCQLWDMSMEPEVAEFLQEYKAVSVLIDVINRCKAPRINEICVGILGNMCCVPDLCEEMTQNETFVSLVLSLLSNTEFDPPTLKETMRLLSTCLCNRTVRDIWIKKVRESLHVKALIIFLFQSSTNTDLLKSTGDVIDVLLDVSDDLCNEWASTELVKAMLEAVQQIGYRNSEELKPFLHVFQLLSTSQPGVKALIENGQNVMDPLLHYLAYICDYEIVSIEDHLACLSYIASLLHLFVTSNTSITEYLASKPSLLEYMMKVLEGLYHASDDSENVTGMPRCILTSRQYSTDSQTAEEEHRHSTTTAQKCEPTDRHSRRKESSDQSRQISDKSREKKSDEGKAKEVGDTVEVDAQNNVNEEYIQQLRALYELLQNYLCDFFDGLHLNKASTGTALDKRQKCHTLTNAPPFLPVLQCLNKSPRHHISYLVHTLVYDLPPSTVDECITAKGDCPSENVVSEKGSKSVKHLIELCKVLKLKRVTRVLTEVMKTVR